MKYILLFLSLPFLAASQVKLENTTLLIKSTDTGPVLYISPKAADCFDNGNDLTLMFKDFSILEFEYMGKFTCDRPAWFILNTDQLNKIDSVGLLNVTIQSYKSITTDIISDEQSAAISQMIK